MWKSWILDWGSTIALLVAGGIWLLVRARQVKAYDRQRARAIKARARIVKVNRSEYSRRSGDILANLALEVIPPHAAPYQLDDIEWYIQPGAAARVQEGLEMGIRIDADNPRVIMPAEKWARIS